MPLTLKQLVDNTAQVTVKVNDDDLNVEYCPGRLTDKLYSELENMKQFSDINEKIVLLVKSWDLFEDEEQTVMFPLTIDRLSEIPTILKTEILYAIMGDVRPQSQAPQKTQTQKKLRIQK